MNEQLQQDMVFNAALSFYYFEILKFCQNKLKFNDVYSRNNLPKIKDGACVIYPDE